MRRGSVVRLPLFFGSHHDFRHFMRVSFDLDTSDTFSLLLAHSIDASKKHARFLSLLTGLL